MKTKELFTCAGDKCIHSCCGEFDGISPLLRSLEGRRFSDIVLTPQDAARLLTSKYSQLIYRDEDGLYKIKTDADGACRAFKDHKCVINDIKPTVCKAYPLYLDMFIGLCVLNDCIAVKYDDNYKTYLNELEPMLDMYDFWIKYLREKICRMKK